MSDVIKMKIWAGGVEFTFLSRIPEAEAATIYQLKAGLVYTGSFQPVRATRWEPVPNLTIPTPKMIGNKSPKI